ncbi:hypothetical protein [Halorussus marinus]|uniref:hypothetical protein n=1 Tax=Halorussus marinus TaxID=2505976 RepID=UPI00106E1EE8|nr:hypothetical protein [Halorussus marinus]
MPDQPTPDAADVPIDSDPDALRAREGVDVREETRVHDDRDHCAADGEGRVAVGVTDEAGAVLAIVLDDGSRAMLPNGTAEPGDDWAAAGRERVEHLTDLRVEIDGPERVRRVEHVVEGSPDPHATSYEVVFAASPADPPDERRVSDGCDWRAEWLDELPDAVEDGPAAEDVRLFAD